LHGDVTHDVALSVMAKSHIFLQHCVRLPRQGIESQAVSLLEAMGHGLVPIVTRHGGMSDHVSNGNRGWLVEERDEAAMAGHIVAMADDAEARARIGAAARDYVVEHFSREAVYPALRRRIGIADETSSEMLT
jgi:glycosyltransferase involved in cell wall biosynthesis